MVASTYANMKKGSPAPSESAVEQTQLKHKKAITSKKDLRPITTFYPEMWPRLQSPPSDFVSDLSIEATIEEVVEEVFGGRRFTESDPFPSISGHYDMKRKFGGAAWFLRDYVSFRSGTELHSMDYHPHVGVIVTRGLELINPIEDLYLNSARNFTCRPSFILEPLKVRTVTAGPSLEYFLCMSLQKFMWRTLKDHPTFQLIGTPVTAELLSNFLLPRSERGVGAWLSGDYSAATDNLRQRFSRSALNYICKITGVPPQYRRLASKSLVGHKIEYTEKTGKKFKINGTWKEEVKKVTVDQWNGQLMGSPLSFPILCIVNAAICKLSFEMGQWGSGRLRDMPILVNGDDCVMKFNEKQKLNWEGISAQAGLSPSVGKCYYAKRWLQINSVNFLLTGDAFEAIPYYNFSLCNETKSKGNDTRHWSDLGAAAREFVRGHDDKVKSHLIQFFLRRQRKLLAKCPTGISWWLPECLGGLGIPIPSNWEPSVTYRQRQLATYLMGRIEAGEPPLKRGCQAAILQWVQNGMRMARAFERPLRKEAVLEDEWASARRVASYGPFMWRALTTSSVEDCETVVADDLSGCNRWYKAWKDSKSCNFTRDLKDLLSYKPPQFEVQPLLTKIFAKSYGCVPSKLLAGILAKKLLLANPRFKDWEAPSEESTAKVDFKLIYSVIGESVTPFQHKERAIAPDVNMHILNRGIRVEGQKRVDVTRCTSGLTAVRCAAAGPEATKGHVNYFSSLTEFGNLICRRH